MDVLVTHRLRFLRALRSRLFVLFWTGQTISALGNGAFSTALAWQVLVLTGSATAMGVILVAQTLPLLIFLLIGGVAADHLPRRLVLLWSDAGRAAVVLLIAALGWTHLLQFWHLVALALIFGFVSAFFYPAYRAIPPQLVVIDDLSSANALTAFGGQMGILLGPLLGAVFVSLGSPANAFGFDGLTFVISALSLLAMRNPSPSSAHEPPIREALPHLKGTGVQRGVRRVIADLREGASYIAGSTWLLMTIIIPAIGSLGSQGPLAVALPKLIHTVYGTGVWLLGVFGTALGLGWLAATLFVGQVHLRKRGIVAFAVRMLASGALILLGLPLPHASEPMVAIVAGALYGFGIGTLQTIWVTLLHELVPNDKLGRVSSIDAFGSFCLLPISYLLAGVLADHIGPAWVFVAGGVFNLVLSAIALCIRDIRALA